jgi:predicted RND superfamily exporter protein
MDKQIKEKPPSWLSKYSESLVRFRFIIVFLVVAACIAISIGQSKVGFSSDYHYYFGESTPVIDAMEALENTYSHSDSIYFSITPKNKGSVFNNEVLMAVEELTNQAWQIPFSTRVDSISNFQHTRADNDDLLVSNLIENAEFLTVEQISEIENVALSEPFLMNYIISENAKHTGVNTVLTLPGKSPMETPTAVAAARELAKNISAKYSVDIHLSGVHMLNNAFGEIGMQDITRIMPIMYGLMAIILLVLFRSILQVCMAIVIVHLSTITAMGLVGWIGIPLTAPSSIAPTIILTLAVADSVHIIISFVLAMRLGKTKKEAVKESILVNFKPIFLTTFTTVVGFLALNFADAPPYHDLGNITAMGVLIAFILSITLLPALLLILPNWIKVQPVNKSTISSKIWTGLSRFVIKKYSQIIVVFTISIIVLATPIPSLVLDDRWVDYFSTKTDFRNDADFVQENLTGLYSVEFNIPSAGVDGISEPEYLKVLEEFSEFYRSQDLVYNVNVITDTLKRLNKSLHGDNQEFYKLPENRVMTSQYLLLYELSLPYGLDLTNQISMDKSSTKFVVTFKDLSTQELRDAAQVGELWLYRNAPEYMYATGSGATVIFAHQSDVNIKGMVFGTTLSLIFICLVVFIAMRDIRYGLISILPNVLPAVVTFGVWTLIRGQAGMEVSIVISATFGVIVDNGVHFMTKYIKGRKEQGLEPGEAILYAYQNVGSALIFTSITLIAGYLVLTLSSFSLNSSLGLMSAITVAAALIIVNVLLPAIILLIDKESEKETIHQTQSLKEAI